MNRNHRALMAKETLSIIDRGYYTNGRGDIVSIGDAVESSVENTVLYAPESADTLKSILPAYKSKNTFIDVRNETTLSAAKRLVESGLFSRVSCLNFASAKNPGGGFLGGSEAQEENLVRSSALYDSLVKQTRYYEYNRNKRTALYSDYIIYTPDVPVFRDDSGVLIERPYLVSFITSPAVNAGAIRKNEPQNIEAIYSTLARRAEYILTVAAHQHCDALVLGAWGCGVFRNDPKDIADIWYHHLAESKDYIGRFKNVTFAVLDRNDRGSYQWFYKMFNQQNI